MAVHSEVVSLTRLLLRKSSKSANDRMLFGRPSSTKNVTYDTVKYLFTSGQVFGFVRWRGDRYGTQTWRVCIAKSGVPGERMTRIPGVKPGAHLLLHAFGKARAKRARRAIDNLAERHVLHEIVPAYWRHVHLQIARNLPLEPYDVDTFRRIEVARSLS